MIGCIQNAGNISATRSKKTRLHSSGTNRYIQVKSPKSAWGDGFPVCVQKRQLSWSFKDRYRICGLHRSCFNKASWDSKGFRHCNLRRKPVDLLKWENRLSGSGISAEARCPGWNILSGVTAPAVSDHKCKGLVEEQVIELQDLLGGKLKGRRELQKPLIMAD